MPEQIGGKIVQTPAVVIETEIYSQEQIAEWDKLDSFGKGERKTTVCRLSDRR